MSLISLGLRGLLFLSSFLPEPQRIDASWIDGFPAVERVLGSLEGDSPLDTRARRASAFSRLAFFIQELSENTSGRKTIDYGAYAEKVHQIQEAYTRTRQELEAGVSDAERQEYARLSSDYGLVSPEWLDELVRGLFTEEWRQRWYAPYLEREAAIARRAGTAPPLDDGKSEERKRGFLAGMAFLGLGLLGALIAYFLGGRLAPIGPGTSDPLDPVGTTGRLGAASGRIRGLSKHVEHNLSVSTRVTGGPHGHTTTSVSMDATVVHEFFLADDRGRQLPFRLEGWNMPLAEDQRVSVVWAEPRDRPREGQGPGTVMFVNHTSAYRYFDRKALRDFVAPKARGGLLLLALAVLTLFLVPMLGLLLIATLVGFACGRIRAIQRRLLEFETNVGATIAKHLEQASRHLEPEPA